MAGLPQEIGQEDQPRERAAGPGPGRRQPKARTGIGQQPDQSAGAQKKSRIFRQQSQAGSDARRQPPAPIARLLQFRQTE